MADIDIETVSGKLNRIGYDAFISALRQAKNAGNSHVELAHWLYHIFQVDRSDMVLTADHFGLDRAKMLAEMQRAVDALRKNETQLPSISPAVVDCLDRGWHYATLMFGEVQIRTGHILVGALKDLELRRALLDISREFRNIPVDRLTDEHHNIWRGSDEETLRPMDRSGLTAAPAAAGPGEARPGGTSALARFSVDLTERAARGEMDPIVGREEEVRQVVDVLMRRRQNNPILVGEAGVGKTAVVEGFAQLLATDQVPPKLHGVRLHALDVGLLQAGASMKGEFEQRLRSVIDEVQSSPQPVILFIDEAHTLIGAGGQAGTGDAANLLKPALARGTLRTIAATTWGEYRQYFEKDPALTRRFQPVQIGEPSVERCCDMLRGLVGPMQTHHGVKVTDAALVAAVQLSHRYIPGRQLPDKAVSLLDTAAARVAISQSATPAAIEDAKALIAARAKEKSVLETERELGTANEARIAEIDAEIATAETELAELEARWSREKTLVEEINRLRDEIAKTAGAKPDGGGAAEARPTDGDDADAPADAGASAEPQPQPLGATGNPEAGAEASDTGDSGPPPPTDPRSRLREAVHELQEISPESRMLYAHVDEQAIAAVVSDWTGIPVGRMVRDEVEAVMRLPEILGRRVVGQSHGLEMIARRIETNRARLDNPNKPIGVFMLCGPSGVGKTETALALAEALYGGEQNVITINMSEYQEGHTVALLKGAPPGYVGYGEGGRLTEAVRRRPYSVVLLDEVEKAHPDVHEIFFQVFDKGQMEDATGRHINFKNTLIILTSNVGTDIIVEAARDPDDPPDPETLAARLKPALLSVFPPALLGRIVTIPYYPLSPTMLAGIVRLHLDRIGKRLRENHKAAFEYGDDLLDHIIARCDDPDSGGRMIDNIITNTLLPQLSRKILSAALDQKEIARVRAYVENGEIALEVE